MGVGLFLWEPPSRAIGRNCKGMRQPSPVETQEQSPKATKSPNGKLLIMTKRSEEMGIFKHEIPSSSAPT